MKYWITISVLFYLLSVSFGFKIFEQEISNFEEEADLKEDIEESVKAEDAVSGTIEPMETTDPGWTEPDSTGPADGEMTTEDDGSGDGGDEGGLSDGEIAAIVICSIGGTALLAGGGYALYRSRSPDEDLTFSSLSERDLQNYGSGGSLGQNGAHNNAHSNPTYAHSEQASNYRPQESFTGTFKSTSHL